MNTPLESNAEYFADLAGRHGDNAPRRYILLSIAAAVITITLKAVAFLLTGSVGLFSDAAESVINLVAALFAFGALTVAARPADREHAYGHHKAEYFASGLESSLILVAAAAIAYAAWGRLWAPQPLENVAVGLAVTAVATAVNGGVAAVLIRAGSRLRSITLRADGHHLLTDVWTSVGVILGVLLVQLTGLNVLDPIVAFLVAGNIVFTGVRLLRDSAYGLLDTVLPAADLQRVTEILARYEAEGIAFHALRTRVAGQRRFISMHVLVPGVWTIQRGHSLCEKIETEIIHALPLTTVFTHLEPREDPRSMDDQGLDRAAPRRPAERPARDEVQAR
jgi:cation diffusion facilitator family transporter